MKKCKHNGRRGYWSDRKGSVCLKCGAEVFMTESPREVRIREEKKKAGLLMSIKAPDGIIKK
jgi:hypothetical protein